MFRVLRKLEYHYFYIRKVVIAYSQYVQHLSSEAYRLFSKGKTPVQVAIELNLRQPDATALFSEY
jgi:hypothetical protein